MDRSSAATTSHGRFAGTSPAIVAAPSFANSPAKLMEIYKSSSAYKLRSNNEPDMIVAGRRN
jgi:hypothetical protein